MFQTMGVDTVGGGVVQLPVGVGVQVEVGEGVGVSVGEQLGFG